MQPSIFFGPEELDQSEVEECLAAAVRLQDIIKKNPIDTIGRARGVYRLLDADNPYTCSWAPQEVEAFGVMDLPNLFHRLWEQWPLLPSYYSLSNTISGPYSRVVLIGLVTGDGQPTYGGAPLYWTQKLGYFDRLGICALVPREGALRPDKDKKSLPMLDEETPPTGLAGKELSITYIVKRLTDDDGYEAFVEVKADNTIITNMPGYPPVVFNESDTAVEAATDWANKLCAELKDQGHEVVSTSVLKPDGTYIQL